MDYKLYLGNCLEVMKQIPDKSVDLVLTDPPYGITACKWDSVIPFEDMWNELKRIRKDNTAICLFGSEPFSSMLRMSNIKEFKYDWIWVKERGTGIGNARKMPLKKHEIISIFYKNLPKYDYVGDKLSKPYSHILPASDKNTGGIIGSVLKAKKEKAITRSVQTYTHKTKHSVIEISRDNMSKGKSFHPTQKPVALLEYLIKTYTNEGETVLDNTMGSGSTGVACSNTLRNFIGIELDEKYFEIAKKRIEDAENPLD